jgi:hypothetical protein
VPDLAAYSWAGVLLALRIAFVGLLYLFLLRAFRALTAELRVAREGAVPASAPAVAVPTEAGPRAQGGPPPSGVEGTWDEDDEWDQWEPEPATRAPAGASRRARLVGIGLLLGSGSLLLTALILGFSTGAPEADPQSATFAPPTTTPAPGRVTVGLAAVEDSGVRVTVDGVVDFAGVMRAGQQQQWEGTQRIQVWTDRGQTLLLSVNGQNLGPYSPAMGRPDWNRIDFGFWPGWEP